MFHTLASFALLIPAFAAVLIALPFCAQAQGVLEVEAGAVITGYNDIRIPGDTGTRFSLTDDLEASAAGAFRIRYTYPLSGRHSLALFLAPLTVTSRGILGEETVYYHETFPAGTSVEATYRFDSYRLIYRYLLHESPRWRFSIGAAGKIRDAAIKLEGGGLLSEKTNLGFVPLLSFNATWAPTDRFQLLIDGEGLAAPQGRAEDVLAGVQYDATQRFSLRAGYRILEGGADNDEVYTFSLFHYFVGGLVYNF